MEILSEELKEQIVYELDLTEDEIKTFIEFADTNISNDELDNLKIEWSINKCLENFITEEIK